MADYHVDPFGLRALAMSLGSLAESGPSGALPAADACGHAPTAALLDHDAAAFRGGWHRADESVLDIAAAADAAAEQYAVADDGIASSAAAFQGGVSVR
jgi:hypothetical protein